MENSMFRCLILPLFFQALTAPPCNAYHITRPILQPSLARCSATRNFHWCPVFMSENASDENLSNTGDELNEKRPVPKNQSFESGPPPLTTMERERRRFEIELLSRLYTGDDAISEFKALWFFERGSEMQSQLFKADFAIGNPKNWEESENILNDLIRSDPTFLEPKVRLSKLCCLQGRFDDSLRLAQEVLELRPWHFVVLDTMVAVYTGKGNTDMAQMWASRRLPTPSQREKRKLWVDRALRDAKEVLARLEEQSSRDFFGPLDDHAGFE
jgi:hypothetical protein